MSARDRRTKTPAKPVAAGSGTNRYQVALSSFVFPYLGHLMFVALVAAGIALTGHPKTAAVFLAGAGAFDMIQQWTIRRWLRTSAGVDQDIGLRRVALLSAVRVSVFLAPTVVLAARGDGPEIFLFCAAAMALVAMGLSASIVSRGVFWGFALPVMGAAVVVALCLPGWAAVAGGLTMLAGLAFLMWSLSEAIARGAKQWLAKYDANVAVIPELRAAREKAEGARAAADAARQAASRADQAKSSFLATMSHEIRTPMNGVLGMAQLLRRDETDPVKTKRLDVLLESGEHLLSLLNDVLDLSRIEAGRLEIVPEPENLRLFLDRLVGLWDGRAEEKGVRLALELGDNVPDTVLVDAHRLRQVLSNLLSNALKFTHEGSVELLVTARAKGAGVMLVRMMVRDTGPGIAAEDIPHLFDRYAQGQEGLDSHGGTGLGLAIARQLTELMGGRIWVKSTVGVGSTFHVEVPLSVAAAVGPAAQIVEPAALAAGLRVLVVDDNAVNLQVLDQFLRALGHLATRAASAPEALELLAAQRFDVVLTDIHMPVMGGREVLQALREGSGPNRDVPVVALTADVTSGGLEHYLAQGFADHVVKPAQMQDLGEALTRAVAAPPPVAKPQRAPAGRAGKARGRGPSGR